MSINRLQITAGYLVEGRNDGRSLEHASLEELEKVLVCQIAAVVIVQTLILSVLVEQVFNRWLSIIRRAQILFWLDFYSFAPWVWVFEQNHHEPADLTDLCLKVRQLVKAHGILAFLASDP